MSCRQAAARFGVSASSAIRWAAQVRFGGALTPMKQGGDRRSHRIEDEDELLRIEVKLAFKPCLPGSLHIGALLLSGMRNLFLSVIRWRWKKRQSVPIPALLPRSLSFS